MPLTTTVQIQLTKGGYDLSLSAPTERRSKPVLSIIGVSKEYVTGDLKQVALDGVSLNLRDSEFVAILGPSGSGKTTLLNIIGGLDRYDSGELIIDDVSTSKYRDRDWDSYRNHSVGFVFQSYNLIPHQSVLANVELALTISGVSRTERREKAKAALEKVGLGDQLHKRPNQLSGGQMQRVAIARALVNDPEVLLADEPTGALDTHTSVQIMDLLKEVASDRLVVMVTHNPELAEEYATRTVKLRDGKIISDTDPFDPEKDVEEHAKHRNLGKASMSFLTALSLSFNNLRTKKARTFLTSFAGSIGIIGIALILSLSNGVSAYIADTQKDTMASYPITIDAQAIDLTSMIEAGTNQVNEEPDHDMTSVHSNALGLEMVSTAQGSISENNLTAFKKHLETPGNAVSESVGEDGIIYSYAVDFSVYARDKDDELVNTDGSTFENDDNARMLRGMGAMTGFNPGFGNADRTSVMEEIIPSSAGDPVGPIIQDNYELLAGEWPNASDQLVLILDENNELPLSVIYQLGLLPSQEYKDLLEKIEDGDNPTFDAHDWGYDDLLGTEFKMLARSDYFEENDNGTFSEITEEADIDKLVDEKGRTLQIAGIIKPVDTSDNSPMNKSVGYTNLLTKELIDYTDDSPIVKAQKEDPKINILSGVDFKPVDDAAKVEETIKYLKALPAAEKAQLAPILVPADQLTVPASETPSMPSGYPEGVDPQNLPADGQQMPAAQPSEADMGAALDNYLDGTPDEEALLQIYDQQLSSGTYDGNLTDFGVVSIDTPSSINIYADSFEDKDKITDAISAYNDSASTEDQIIYTDYVGLLMSAVTTMVDVVSYVLIAFVGVSLVVSSIMIGIITFISVLERTKEIGVLRAIGASKGNVSAVFNAETMILGLLSGAIGIGTTLLLLIPANALIHYLTGIDTVNAALPVGAGIGLVVLSTVLTLIAGLVPSGIAARKDPVTALRSE